MSQSDDLTKLFDRFGGRQDTYREIVREDAAKEARERWPLLAAMRADQSMPTPPVQAASLTSGLQPAPAAPADRGIGARFADPEPDAVIAPPTAPGIAPTTAPGIAPAATPQAAAAQPLWQPAAPVATPALPPLEAPAQTHAPRAATPASGNLQNVFARLEGRADAPAPAERAPARRSFLDRLNRS